MDWIYQQMTWYTSLCGMCYRFSWPLGRWWHFVRIGDETYFYQGASFITVGYIVYLSVKILCSRICSKLCHPIISLITSGFGKLFFFFSFFFFLFILQLVSAHTLVYIFNAQVAEAKESLTILQKYLERRGIALPEGYLSFKVICPNLKFGYCICFLQPFIQILFSDNKELIKYPFSPS